MNATELKRAITATARGNDIGCFADRLGMMPESARARKMFADFQELARLMRRFNSNTLARLIRADLAPGIARRREARHLMNSRPLNRKRERAILNYRDAMIAHDAEAITTDITLAPDEETRMFLCRLKSLTRRSAIEVLNEALAIAFWVSNERMEAWANWQDRLKRGPRRHTRRKEQPTNEGDETVHRKD